MSEQPTNPCQCGHSKEDHSVEVGCVNCACWVYRPQPEKASNSVPDAEKCLDYVNVFIEDNCPPDQVVLAQAENGKIKSTVLIKNVGYPQPEKTEDLQSRYDALSAVAKEMAEAMEYSASWRMRDGTPCSCPAGRNEDEPKGKMPTIHATGCAEMRIALAAYRRIEKEE